MSTLIESEQPVVDGVAPTNGGVDWERVRREFPATKSVAYLKSAATGLLAPTIADVVARLYEETREGDKHWGEWIERRERARLMLAQMINAEPDEIAFTPNTSVGMNLIVDALEGSGEVISCELEFPTVTLPWLHRGIKLHVLPTPEGEINIERIREAMTARTSVICLSHVQFSNGFRADLEAIGAGKEAHTFVVCASQSAGVLPIDVKRMKIDALCTTGHKWMLAGFGTGFVYMSRELMSRRLPRAISWMSVEEPFKFRNRDYTLLESAAARAEIGTPAMGNIFALGASVEYLMRLGIENIEGRALELNERLTARLTEEGWQVLSPLRDEAFRSAETLVRVDAPARIVAHLAAHGVQVSEKLEGIRVAMHFFNDEADVERLVEALAKLRS